MIKIPLFIGAEAELGSVGQLKLSGGLEELSAIICRANSIPEWKLMLWHFSECTRPSLLSIGAKCSAMALHKALPDNSSELGLLWNPGYFGRAPLFLVYMGCRFVSGNMGFIAESAGKMKVWALWEGRRVSQPASPSGLEDHDSSSPFCNHFCKYHVYPGAFSLSLMLLREISDFSPDPEGGDKAGNVQLVELLNLLK